MSKKSKEILVSVPKGAKNIRTSVVDGQIKIKYTITTKAENYEQYFSVVEASELSLDDDFLKHEPQTEEQEIFKQRVKDAIKSGLSDFMAPNLDPSVDKEGNIYYKPGSKPGVDRSSIWWYDNAPKFIPDKSRLGTTAERIAFLAVLIKKDLATWEQICDHSEEIGHYWDSKDAKHDLEKTGSRPVGEFYDLGNTYKITEKKKAGGFSLVGGNCNYDGFYYPVANVRDSDFPNYYYYYSVGWLVLDM